MSSLAHRLAKIPQLLAERIERYRVPGASLAVLHDGEVFETAAGVVNVDTGVETTPDSVFQIGSITKLMTTTLAMQLVDEGRLDLDAPVRTWLPELELQDAEAARTITPRHLLTHTSGIDGDFFVDTGRGDDAVERFVVACMALPQPHPVGEGFSYCNAGFVIAGRVIEKLRGAPWGTRALRAPAAADRRADALHRSPIRSRVVAVLASILEEEEQHLGVLSDRDALLAVDPSGLSDEARAMIEALGRLHADDYAFAAERSVDEVCEMMARYADPVAYRARIEAAA